MSNIKKWALAISIAIVFNLFVNFGIATFYDSPEYSDFCGEDIRAFPIRAADDCKAIVPNEELRNICAEEKGKIDFKYDSKGCPIEAFCETCYREYNQVRERYDATASIILLIASMVILVAGITLKIESVSTGFLMAGVLGLLITTMRYWSQLQNVLRFLILGLALAILIWLGYKKIK